MNKEELWKKYIANPDAIGESEKIIWIELQEIFSDILTELKTNNKIENNFTHSEINHFKKMMATRNNIAENFGRIVETTDSSKKGYAFLNAIKNFNFNDVNYVYLIIELSIMNMITDIEAFKILLLFHLKDIGKCRAIDFLQILQKYAPINSKRLEPYITNTKIRNSLAHGTWAMENNQIVLFDDANLIPFKKLEIIELIEMVKKQNILIGCLSSVISDKIDKDFFE
jgi:hypothetical protein